jgi:hypothetical protein
MLRLQVQEKNNRIAVHLGEQDTYVPPPTFSGVAEAPTACYTLSMVRSG